MRWVAVVLGLAVAVAVCCEPTPAGASTREVRLAVAPLKRSVRDVAVTSAVQESLQMRLGAAGEVIGAADTRDALRRFRLRDIDAASSGALSRLAAELGFDWLVVATVHDARSVPVADLSVSVRFYDDDGNLVWSGFEGRSGLDGETILGLGVVDSIGQLAPVVVDRLLASSPVGGALRDDARRPRVSGGTELGKVALLPLTSYVEDDALVAAEAATEAARAVLHRSRISLAAPRCVQESMRRQVARQWGELPLEARAEIRADCSVDLILTGSVELWRVRGTGLVPVPEVSASLRLLEAASGRILWTGAREGTGRDGFGLFRWGRVYSRGALLVDLLSDLIRTLMRSEIQLASAGMQDPSE